MAGNCFAASPLPLPLPLLLLCRRQWRSAMFAVAIAIVASVYATPLSTNSTSTARGFFVVHISCFCLPIRFSSFFLFVFANKNCFVTSANADRSRSLYHVFIIILLFHISLPPAAISLALCRLQATFINFNLQYFLKHAYSIFQTILNRCPKEDHSVSKYKHSSTFK